MAFQVAFRISYEKKHKYHLLMTKDKSSKSHWREFIIKSSDCEKLLGIKIDPKICF